MPLLNVPHCGQKLTLRRDCEVNVDYATTTTAGKMGVALGILTHSKSPYGHDLYAKVATGMKISYENRTAKTVIPAGTVLEITQMYIRNKGWGDDSMTFRVDELPGHKIKACRFALPLAEANKLDVDLAEME